MDDYIKRIRTNEGDKPIDYNALANAPAKVEWSEDINETFTINYVEDEGAQVSDLKTLGLVIGNTYNILFRMYSGNVVSYAEEFNAQAEDDVLGAGTANITCYPSDSNIGIEEISISDSTTVSIEKGLSILGVAYAGVSEMQPFEKIEITITGKGKHPIVTFLPGYYIKAGAIEDGHLSIAAKRGVAEYLEKKGIFATSEDVEEILDELHAYAQALIGGDA